MIAQARPARECRMRMFNMRRDPWPPQPWVLLAADDGWEAACHLDDALLAAIYGRWREGALITVTDAMRAAAGEVVTL